MWLSGHTTTTTTHKHVLHLLCSMPELPVLGMSPRVQRPVLLCTRDGVLVPAGDIADGSRDG